MNEDKREQIYDERINPLMAEIIKICKENNIPFVASFQLSANEAEEGPLYCTSCSLPNGSSDRLIQAKDVLYQRVPVWAYTITKQEDR